MTKYIPKGEKLVGPPAPAAIPYVRARLADSCIECECCGQMWHFKAEKRHGFALQINIAGRVMSVRKAEWIAFFHQRKVIKGMRITSNCENPNCINPKLLVQVNPGTLLAKHYKDGIRSKAQGDLVEFHHICGRAEPARIAFQTVKQLVALRTPETIRAMEQERGLRHGT